MVQELEKRTRIDVADVLRGLAVMGIIVCRIYRAAMSACSL